MIKKTKQKKSRDLTRPSDTLSNGRGKVETVFYAASLEKLTVGKLTLYKNKFEISRKSKTAVFIISKFPKLLKRLSGSFRNFRKYKNNQRDHFGISERIKTIDGIVSEIPKEQKQPSGSFRNFRKYKNNYREAFEIFNYFLKDIIEQKIICKRT